MFEPVPDVLPPEDVRALCRWAREGAADIRESFDQSDPRTHWLFEIADLLDALATARTSSEGNRV